MWCAGKEKIKKCSCGNILWEWLDENTIRILGQNGQDYEIGFTYLILTCKKCGKKHGEESDIADQIKDMFLATSGAIRGFTTTGKKENSYAHLNNFQRKEILKNLSANQKEIFRLLIEAKVYGSILSGSPRIFNEFLDNTDFPSDVLIKNIKQIEKEIRKIEPNFDKEDFEFINKSTKNNKR